MTGSHQTQHGKNFFVAPLSKSEIETLFGVVIKKIPGKEGISSCYNVYLHGEIILHEECADDIRHAFELLTLRVIHLLLNEADEEAET